MGVPTLEVDYTSATAGRGGHEVHKGHVVKKKCNENILTIVGKAYKKAIHNLD
jgi:hypothetical protein